MPTKLNPHDKRTPPTADAVALDHDAEWLWRVYRSRLQDALNPGAPPMETSAPVRKRKAAR